MENIENIIFCLITAFGITFIAIPSLIAAARIKQLYDEPGERASHATKVPTLGGLAIFAGVIFATCFWSNFKHILQVHEFREFQYITAALLIIFFIGIKDDVVGLSPFKKFLGQIFAATIVVVWGNIRLTSLYGILDIFEISEYFSIFISIFTIIVIINAYNLIDGINGLSASIGIISAFAFGTWFYLVGNNQFVYISFALVGALIGFLRYNISPARIFMGDTGSLLIGLIMAILAIKFIEMNKGFSGEYKIRSVPVVAIGFLLLPLYDLFRVFITRIYHRKSPFKPDKKHIHHRLLELGFSHSAATALLSVISIAFIILVLLLQHIGPVILGLIIFVLASLLSLIPVFLIRKRNKAK